MKIVMLLIRQLMVVFLCHKKDFFNIMYWIKPFRKEIFYDML